MTGWTPFIAPDFEGDVAHYSRPDGKGGFEILSAQDVAPILDRNKAMRNHNDGYTADRTMRRAAYIPAVIRNKWLNEEGWDAYRPDLYAEQLVRKLNDPDWAYLRTADGRLAASNGRVR